MLHTWKMIADKFNDRFNSRYKQDKGGSKYHVDSTHINEEVESEPK